MRNAIALALVAAGAILTFAVSAQVPGISLRGAGVIVILTGIAALFMPPSPAADWLRRRPGRDPAALAADDGAPTEPDDGYPDYLLQDPAVLAAEVLNGIRSDSWRHEHLDHGDHHHGDHHHGHLDHGDHHHEDDRQRDQAPRRGLYSVRGDLDRRDGVG